MGLFERAEWRKPTAAHFRDAGYGVATNRTNDWYHCGLDVTVQGRTLSLHVASGNRAVDRAFESDFGAAVAAALESVNWTRTSGGEVTADDEHSRREFGGSGYRMMRFGHPETLRAQDDAEARSRVAMMGW